MQNLDHDLLTRAFLFACEAHKDQRRKYTNEPYVNHCAAVAARVTEVTEDCEVIAAALLHDTIEDTNTQFGQLETQFGYRVADLVKQVTDKSKKTDGNRAVRKEIDRLHLSTATKEAKTIKLADLIDNTRSITTYDPEFAEVYMKEKKALMEVLKEGDGLLYEVAQRIIERWERTKHEHE